MERGEFVVRIEDREGLIVTTEADQGRDFKTIEEFDAYVAATAKAEKMYCMKTFIVIFHIPTGDIYRMKHEVLPEKPQGLRERVVAYCDWYKEHAHMFNKEPDYETIALWRERLAA